MLEHWCQDNNSFIQIYTKEKKKSHFFFQIFQGKKKKKIDYGEHSTKQNAHHFNWGLGGEGKPITYVRECGFRV
jgi:hypothetical protein